MRGCCRALGGRGCSPSTSNVRRRLLKIKCKNIDARTKILQKARELRHHPEFRGVFLNQDRTPLQQTVYKELRTELLHRKQAGEDVIIKRDCVVLRKDVRQNF